MASFCSGLNALTPEGKPEMLWGEALPCQLETYCLLAEAHISSQPKFQDVYLLELNCCNICGLEFDIKISI
jgi:hypothetical protein